MDSASYSKRGYVKVKKEATPGVAVKPDVLWEIVAESIEIAYGVEPVEAIAGSRSMFLRATPGQMGPFTGDIEMFVDLNTVGHLLTGVLGEDEHATFTAGVSELSVYEPKNVLPSYTVDVARGGLGYVTRFFGVRFTKLVLSVDANRVKAVLTVAAQRAFTNARVTADASSGTALALDQTSGLTTSDTLLVLDQESQAQIDSFGVAAIGSELGLTTGSAITGSLVAKDYVVIKADVVDDEDFNRGKELTFVGGAEVAIGKGENGLQKLLARANVENFTLTLENGFEARWGLTGGDHIDRMPSTILLKGVQVSGGFSGFHAGPEWLDALRSTDPIGMTVKFLGDALEANALTAATAVLESSGAGQVTVTLDGTAIGDVGNEYAVKVVQGAGTLSATLSGKLITVTLDADAGDNTVALVATAIDTLLTGIGNAASAGSGNVTVADNPDKLNFSGGRDASQRAHLTIEVPKAVVNPFAPNLGTDDVLMDEIEFQGYRDQGEGREVRAKLLNGVTSY